MFPLFSYNIIITIIHYNIMRSNFKQCNKASFWGVEGLVYVLAHKYI